MEANSREGELHRLIVVFYLFIVLYFSVLIYLFVFGVYDDLRVNGFILRPICVPKPPDFLSIFSLSMLVDVFIIGGSFLIWIYPIVLFKLMGKKEMLDKSLDTMFIVFLATILIFSAVNLVYIEGATREYNQLPNHIYIDKPYPSWWENFTGSEVVHVCHYAYSTNFSQNMDVNISVSYSNSSTSYRISLHDAYMNYVNDADNITAVRYIDQDGDLSISVGDVITVPYNKTWGYVMIDMEGQHLSSSYCYMAD